MSAEKQPKSPSLVSHILRQAIPAGDLLERHPRGEKKAFLPSSLHLLITRHRALTPTLTHTHVEDHVNVARVTSRKESGGFRRKRVNTATP